MSLWRRLSSIAGTANSSAAYNLISVFWQGMDLLKMLDAKLECFSLSPFIFAGNVPSCRANSRAWWEGPRRGRCLEGKCRRERGKPKKLFLCVMDSQCNVCAAFFVFFIFKCARQTYTFWGEVTVFVSFWWTEGINSLFLNCSSRWKLIQFIQFQCVCWLWGSGFGRFARLKGNGVICDE